MESTTQKINDTELELTVELNGEDLKEYATQAEDQFGQEVQIDGFRKGKAPREQVRKQVGAARILEAAMELALNNSLAKTLKEKSLDVLEVSKLEVKENTPAKLLYKVILTLFPQVTLSPLASVKVKKQTVQVGQKDIDDTLQTIRTSRASYSDKEGPAETGDKVEVDFEVKENGKVIEGGLSKNHPIVLGSKNFMPGFEEALVGMKKEESKSFSLTAPKDFVNKDIAGKKLDFDVTMRDIKKVTLPELNSEFAKTLGKFESMDQVIANIKEGLQLEKQEKENQRLRLEMVNSIVASSKIAVPEKMITDQLMTMVENFDNDLHRHNMELSLYLAKINKTQEDLKKEWRPEAERQVKMALALHTIAKDNNISVTPEEVDEALNTLVSSVMMRDGGQAPDLDMSKMRTNIASKLLNEKTFEFLEKICSVSA